MREDVIREVVSRLLTDQDFLNGVRMTPRKALAPYQLTEEELNAVSSADDGSLGIGRLENRISAAFISPVMDDCGCVNVTPHKCK